MASSDSGTEPVAGTIDEISDQLYAAPAEQFVSLRKELATAARTSGHRELATAIGELRRPTRSAWVVNLLSREAADEVQALLELAAALRTAQQELSGPDLRRLSGQRHRAVEALAARASSLATEHGVAVSESTRREVVQSLQAALADEAVADQLRAGHLAAVPEYGGFGVFGTGGAEADATPAGVEAATAQDHRSEPSAGEKADEREAERQQLLAEATAAVDAAAEATARAETELDDAESAADQASEAEAELRSELERAEAVTAEATERVEQARQQLQNQRASEKAARSTRADLAGD